MLLDPLPRIEPALEFEDAPAIGSAGSSLEFLQAVYSDPAQPMSRRMRAAIAALPFERPKLAVVASLDAGPGFAARLEAAIAKTAAMRGGGGLCPALPQPADCSVTDSEGSGDIG